jgi:3-oxoacyl-(acyl-carrier-protein) synthase
LGLLNSAADLATVPKGLAGITKAHSSVNGTNWGFISLAICMMAGTASLPHVMMSENIDSKINFTFNQSQKKTINFAMSNTFGFGGHNACVLFKKLNN